MSLLFDLAHWHGLAKLQMHTESTLRLLSEITVSLGKSLREFRDKTCPCFETRELERERAARQRRTAARGKQPSSNGARRVKNLNLNIYKVHSLGDYEEMIRALGVTPSFTSQHVSEHRFSLYPLILTFLSISSNLSIQPLRAKSHGLVANQFLCNCRGSINAVDGFAYFVRNCDRHACRVMPAILTTP